MNLGLYSNSGGLRYHARAFRFRRRLWASYRAELSRWFREVTPSSARRLVLVGGSMGWELELPWLAQFSEIQIVDPDPLAGLGLRLRLRAKGIRVPVRSVRTSSWLTGWDQGWPGLKDAVAAAKARSAPSEEFWVFSNVLGQLEFGDRDPDWKAFVDVLSPVSWVSFHDRLSGDRERGALRREDRVECSRWRASELMSNESGARGGLPSRSLRGPYHDHGTEGLSVALREQKSGAEFSDFVWEIAPRSLHWVEGIASR